MMRPVPGIGIDQQPERIVLRLLICGEARGEQDQGGFLESLAMYAVLCCLRNRQARPRWRTRTLREIALEPWQFSCFNMNDPNRGALLDLWKTDEISWERADTVADMLEAGCNWDPTMNATHYCTKRLWAQEPKNATKPQWYEKPEIDNGDTRLTARIGSHVFAVAP